MRLFVGLDLPPGIVRNLEALLDRLRPAARLRWSPPANLHITTKFIGEWPEERLGELKSALAAMGPRPAIPISIRDLGFFPNPRAPRVFWCGIDAPALAPLAAETDRATTALGIPSATRPWTAHLTLARIKDRFNPERLQQAIAALPSLDFGTFEAPAFFLYRSQPGPDGSVYTKLAEFPFSNS